MARQPARNVNGTEPLIETHGVSVRRGRRVVLAEIDFCLYDGESVAVIGPNGAGKSTLLAALAGQLPLSSGTVARRGRTLHGQQAGALASRSAVDNVELALAWWRVPARERRARSAAALEQMRATHLAHRSALKLSGGEQRRVHLARCIATRPDVLLLDEPFTGLDADTRDSLIGDAAIALRSNARAVVVVIHDRNDAWALADRIVVVLDGRIAADCPTKGLLEEPPSAEVARFVGFTGEIRQGSSVLLVRPAHVRLDAHGPITGIVRSLRWTDDGSRLEIDVAGGRVQALATDVSPRVGERVNVRLLGGARFAVPPDDQDGHR